ncbi:PrgU family protein, partial [Enterococcus faecalis]|uniref:PrgU family protein n=7 Tax=Enterococcus TaxID=1350 RepID=UPI0020919BEB
NGGVRGRWVYAPRPLLDLERTMMEKIKERTGSVAMKELAIQEKEVNTRWQGFRGRLLMIKVKKGKTFELLTNNQVTPENIHEIDVIHLLKNGKTLTLKVDTERSKFGFEQNSTFEVPMFYIETRIKREAYHDYFLSEKELRNEQKNRQGSTMKRGYGDDTYLN